MDFFFSASLKNWLLVLVVTMVIIPSLSALFYSLKVYATPYEREKEAFKFLADRKMGFIITIVADVLIFALARLFWLKGAVIGIIVATILATAVGVGIYFAVFKLITVIKLGSKNQNVIIRRYYIEYASTIKGSIQK